LNPSASFTVDDVDVAALRDLLQHLTRIGYAEKPIRERLGLTDITELRWRALPIYRAEKLEVRDPQASAIDLFLLQGVIPRTELDNLFTQAAQEVLSRAGLLLLDDHGLARARASLYPVGSRLIFSDHAWPSLPHPGCADVPPDQIMYIGSDSRWLARATVRRPVRNALDLCTGSGVHALLAAAHAQRVLAVDVNPRAAQCTRFNALASGTPNLEAAVGDLYDPVGEERFDLITANPPFVPSPRDSLQYRDGGRSGEDVQARIIAGLPLHLAPGGMAQIVTEFGERGDEPLADRLRQWLGGAPMDIHILRMRETTATNYAIGHADGADTYEAFLSSVHDWAANLRKQGYTRIVSVLLAFQWSDPATATPWTRSDSPTSLHSVAGAEITAAFAAERLVRRPDFPELLSQGRLRRAGPIALLEVRALGHEVRTQAQAELLGKALPIIHSLDTAERELLVLLEKPLPFSELLALAQKSDPSLNLDEPAIIKAITALIRRGLVLLEGS
jgi:hypothetical protein